MKNLFLGLCLLAITASVNVRAQDFINLTPKPKQMTAKSGELVLPDRFAISTGDLPEETVAEARKFADAYAAATEATVSVQEATDEALIALGTAGATVGDEGYELDITPEGVKLRARTAAGFYFGFQTLKKLLPPHVMAGVKDPAVTHHALPLVSITDSPRFGYRGFMLDVARHFFSVAEVKRMLDVMAYYKMNRFHWHLSDDQGWRVEIKKYPKLTTVGSIAPNCYVTDMVYGPYWTNQPYGPHFYTQEELADVVAYAKERHIEIIPEIDMPGHFVAALAAYPEYSCSPKGSHTIWTSGGISSDVMNVANPNAVQFAKDILSELMDIFPYELVHIGGDECPTSAWEGNAECQARYRELGLTSYRQLQTHFIKEMAEHIQARGKKVAVWNEAITAGGADTKMIQETGATVFCWQPADASARQAAQLGLNNIFTPWGPYYINRKQSTDPNEPSGAGDGTDNVEKTYNTVPVPTNITASLAKYYTGVQGTFWTEHVADRSYMEYLALPRLIAVAEAGWSQQKDKNFEDFRRRMTADSTLLNYNGYNYCRHQMKTATEGDKVMPQTSTATKKHWYRMVTRATDDARRTRCWELLREGSPLLASYGGNGAAPGVLWTNTQATENDENYDYQLWAFEESADAPGRYALVCKAQPDGSLAPSPTAQSNGGRWTYANGTKHYNFILGDNGYGKADNAYYYSLRSDRLSGWWMNASMGGQGLAVNLWTDPASGNGGHWTAVPIDSPAEAEALLEKLEAARTLLQQAETYEADKRPGRFGAAEKAALQNVVREADPSGMTPEELADFTARFEEAYAAFRRSFGYLEIGQSYSLHNAVAGFNARPADNSEGAYLRHTDADWTDDAWEVTASTLNDDYTQTVQLRNTQTGRFVGTPATAASGSAAYPVGIGTTAGDVLCMFHPATRDFTLSINGKNLFPVPANSLSLPGVVSSGSTISNSNAIRPMGAAWRPVAVRVVTYRCEDEAGNDLGSFRGSFDLDSTLTEHSAPALPNHTPVRVEPVDEHTLRAVYRRTACSITLVCRDTRGALLSTTETVCPLGETHTVRLPQLPYYTLESTDRPDGTELTPSTDLTLQAVYSTTAYNGVRKLAGFITTSPQDGHSYVIYDTSPVNTERIGYRNVDPDTRQVMKTNQIEGADPYCTWTLVKSGSGFKVRNDYVGRYVPQLTTSASPVALSGIGATYTFTLNADGETWKIKGANGVCWDGLGSGALVGWNDPGHPYKLYEYYADPYFEVTVQAVDTEENVLSTTRTLVRAGEPYTLTAAAIEGYTLHEIQGGEALQSVGDHLTVTVVYRKDLPDGLTEVEAARRTPNRIYDLYGRRLDRIAAPGLYIVDGQKVIVK